MLSSVSEFWSFPKKYQFFLLLPSPYLKVSPNPLSHEKHPIMNMISTADIGWAGSTASEPPIPKHQPGVKPWIESRTAPRTRSRCPWRREVGLRWRWKSKPRWGHQKEIKCGNMSLPWLQVMIDNIMGNGLDVPLSGLREASKWDNCLFTIN